MSTNLTAKPNIELSSAEIANGWTNYMNDTVAICMIHSFSAHIDDPEIASVLNYALHLSQHHVEKLQALFKEEQFPIPLGFSLQTDVNLQAPRLYTDDFCLFYIQNIGKMGLAAYARCLANSARTDIAEYYTECLNESIKLMNNATQLMLSKGTFIRSPLIPKPQMVEFVQKQSYLAGWFGPIRPLNVIEMSNIYFNLIQNQLGRTLLMGFSQVAQSPKVRDFLIRGRDIADKQVEILGSLLSKDYLPSPSTWSSQPTNSTTTTYSDKLMMYHTLFLISAGIAHYGESLSQSPRRDLAADYARLTAEISSYAEAGVHIMIENGWMEQPPHASDRNELSNDKM